MSFTTAHNTDPNEVIKKSQYFDTHDKIKAHIEEKHHYQNFRRYLQVQRQECEDYDQLHKRLEAAALLEKRMYRDNKLASELDKLKRPEIRDAKLRQLLRENSPELRELERKLKAAYVNKELAAQIAQKEHEKINKRIQEQNTYHALKTAWVEEQEWRKAQDEKEIIKKAQYKQELQDQIILREKSRRHAYEEFLREKKLIDDIVQRIHDEDEKEIAEKMRKMRKTREEIKSFREARELWRKKKKEEIEEENRRIQEYLLSKAADINAREAQKAKQEALKEKISEELAKQLYEERRKAREREEIIEELMQEEQREALERRHQEDVEKQIRQRIETRKSLFKQMEEAMERKRQEAMEEARYKEELLEEMSRQAKLEQLSEQKRRMKTLQFRRDIEQMMIERRQKHAEEMQLLLKLEEQEKQEDEERKRLVEEERIRMLQEHVKNLVGYLPKNLLKPSDLPHLASEGIFHMDQQNAN